MESYTDEAYAGTCLRAANFVRVGETAEKSSNERRWRLLRAGPPSSIATMEGSEVAMSRKDVIPECIREMLIGRYDRKIMNNVQRGDYVECMIAAALGLNWQLTSEDWDWAAWDCEHTASKARLEIKQSAARQTWDRGSDRSRRNPRFDIRLRTGYWPKDGGPWVTDWARQADVYVFAWHGETDEHADHRDVAQWRFFVVAERLLPAEQNSIGLSWAGENCRSLQC